MHYAKGRGQGRTLVGIKGYKPPKMTKFDLTTDAEYVANLVAVSMWCKLHCVSKNVPLLTCYNLYIHGSIAKIFGTNVTEKVGNQNVLYFPTSHN